jgi:hypothetical protein
VFLRYRQSYHALLYKHNIGNYYSSTFIFSLHDRGAADKCSHHHGTTNNGTTDHCTSNHCTTNHHNTSYHNPWL